MAITRSITADEIQTANSALEGFILQGTDLEDGEIILPLTPEIQHLGPDKGSKVTFTSVVIPQADTEIVKAMTNVKATEEYFSVAIAIDAKDVLTLD